MPKKLFKWIIVELVGGRWDTQPITHRHGSLSMGVGTVVHKKLLNLLLAKKGWTNMDYIWQVKYEIEPSLQNSEEIDGINFEVCNGKTFVTREHITNTEV